MLCVRGRRRGSTFIPSTFPFPIPHLSHPTASERFGGMFLTSVGWCRQRSRMRSSRARCSCSTSSGTCLRFDAPQRSCCACCSCCSMMFLLLLADAVDPHQSLLRRGARVAAAPSPRSLALSQFPRRASAASSPRPPRCPWPRFASKRLCRPTPCAKMAIALWSPRLLSKLSGVPQSVMGEDRCQEYEQCLLLDV